MLFQWLTFRKTEKINKKLINNLLFPVNFPKKKKKLGLGNNKLNLLIIKSRNNSLTCHIYQKNILVIKFTLKKKKKPLKIASDYHLLNYF